MRPAMARLDVVAGRALGMSILLDDELLIGRHSDGAGRLADDEEISRSHARISLDRSGFCAIEDLGSTNGTFVNGLRVTSPQTLSVGDTIEVGGTTLVVRDLPVPVTGRSVIATRSPVTGKPQTPPTSGSTSQETPASTLGPSGRPQRSPRPSERPATHGDTPVQGQPSAPDAQASETVEPAAAPRPLSLTLHVDFEAREATVALDENSDPIRLVFDGYAWRPAAP